MPGIGPMEILIIALVIAVVFGPGAVVLWFLTRARTAAAPPAASGDSALTIARERYARGEITADELAEIARTLGHVDAGVTPDTAPPANEDTPTEV